MKGRVIDLVPDRGFGFIRDESGQEFFFHISALQGVRFEELAIGSPVVFEARRDRAGDEPDERPRAVNIHLADEEIPAVENEPLPARKTGARGAESA